MAHGPLTWESFGVADLDKLYVRRSLVMTYEDELFAELFGETTYKEMCRVLLTKYDVYMKALTWCVAYDYNSSASNTLRQLCKLLDRKVAVHYPINLVGRWNDVDFFSVLHTYHRVKNEKKGDA